MILQFNNSASEMACGEYGEGKMSDPSVIAEEIDKYFLTQTKNKKFKALVTAGPTNEYIDPVRFITNKSSGKQGYELAKSLSKKSFDTNLRGDFNLINNLLKKDGDENFIYIGCQILSRNLFKKYNVYNFSISKVWNELLIKNQLNGFESSNRFYHLTNLDTFKKLEDF